MITQKNKCQQFEALHRRESAFVIPNPWDAGTAKLLQSIGYEALATTSAGFAASLGRKDGKVTLDEKLTHCMQMVEATTVPINVDFENGFGDDPEAVANNIRRLVATGVAGCSIEDFSRDSQALYDLGLAVERIHAAVEVVASLGMPFQLTARAENLFRGVSDLDDTIVRLKAFEKAGANVLFAPGLNTLGQLRQVTEELEAPFNVLSVFFKGVTVDEFSAAGAKRISVGNALNVAVMHPLLKAGKEMLEQGTFNWTAEMAG